MADNRIEVVVDLQVAEAQARLRGLRQELTQAVTDTAGITRRYGDYAGSRFIQNLRNQVTGLEQTGIERPQAEESMTATRQAAMSSLAQTRALGPGYEEQISSAASAAGILRTSLGAAAVADNDLRMATMAVAEAQAKVAQLAERTTAIKRASANEATPTVGGMSASPTNLSALIKEIDSIQTEAIEVAAKIRPTLESMFAPPGSLRETKALFNSLIGDAEKVSSQVRTQQERAFREIAQKLNPDIPGYDPTRVQSQQIYQSPLTGGFLPGQVRSTAQGKFFTPDDVSTADSYAEGLKKVAAASGSLLAGLRLNRIGMLELQAAGVNTFQALASGMNPLRVATMESAQVIGSLIQGVEGGFSKIVGVIASPLVGVAAGVTAIGAALAYVSFKAYESARAFAELNNAMLLQGRPAAIVEQTARQTSRQMMTRGGIGREEAESSAIAIQRVPGISPVARQNLSQSFEAFSTTQFKGDADKATEALTKMFSSTGQMKGFIEENNLLTGKLKEQFDAAVAVGDGYRASELASEGFKKNLQGVIDVLEKARGAFGTLNTTDIFGRPVAPNSTAFGAEVRKEIGTQPFEMMRFPQTNLAPSQTQIQANRAAEDQLKTETIINGLLSQRRDLISGIASGEYTGGNERYSRAQAETELRLSQTRSPVQEDTHQVRIANLEAEQRQLEQAAQHDISKRREVEINANKIADEIAAHAQGALAQTGEAIKKESAEEIAARQRVRDAALETERANLGQRLFQSDYQRAQAPTNPNVALYAAEKQLADLRGSQAGTQDAINQKEIEILGIKKQIVDAAMGEAMAQIQQNEVLAQARGDLETILDLRRQERDLVLANQYSTPQQRIQAETPRLQAEVAVRQGQLRQGQYEGQLRIAQNPGNFYLPLVESARQLDSLQKSGIANLERQRELTLEIARNQMQVVNAVVAENAARLNISNLYAQARGDSATVLKNLQQELATARLLQSRGQGTEEQTQQKLAAVIQAQIGFQQQYIQLQQQAAQADIQFGGQRLQTGMALLNLGAQQNNITREQAIRGEMALTAVSMAQAQQRVQGLLQIEGLRPEQQAQINQQLAQLYEEDAQKQIELQQKLTQEIRRENEKRLQHLKGFLDDAGSAATDLLTAAFARTQTRQDAFKQFGESITKSLVQNVTGALSQFAGAKLATSLGVKIDTSGDTSIGTVLSKYLGEALGITKPEPKLDQAAVQQKMQMAAETHQKAANLLIEAAEKLKESANQGPFKGGKGGEGQTAETKPIPEPVKVEPVKPATATPAQPYDPNQPTGEAGQPTPRAKPPLDPNRPTPEAGYLPPSEVMSEQAATQKYMSPGKPFADTSMQGQMFGWMTQKGYTPQAASAIISNSIHESSLRPDSDLGYPKELGLFQHRDSRRDDLESLASSTGRSPTDWRVQMELMDKELQQLDPTFKKSTESAGTLAQRFEQVFERPKSLADAPRRAQTAEQVFSEQSTRTTASMVSPTEHINYGGTGALGDPRQSGWAEQNLTQIASPSGASFTVNKAAAPDFSAFVNELESSGYKIQADQSGGYNLRNITGGNKLSEHAYGTAVDINWEKNLFSRSGEKVTDLPPNISDMAAKHNLEWGGNWTDPIDTMHFQWRGPRRQGEQQVAQQSLGQPDIVQPAPQQLAQVPQQTIGDILTQAEPRYGQLNPGQSLVKDLQRVEESKIGAMMDGTASRLMSSTDDATLKQFMDQAGTAYSQANPGKNFKDDFQAGKPIAEILKTPVSPVKSMAFEGEAPDQNRIIEEAPRALSKASIGASADDIISQAQRAQEVRDYNAKIMSSESIAPRQDQKLEAEPSTLPKGPEFTATLPPPIPEPFKQASPEIGAEIEKSAQVIRENMEQGAKSGIQEGFQQPQQPQQGIPLTDKGFDQTQHTMDENARATEQGTQATEQSVSADQELTQSIRELNQTESQRAQNQSQGGMGGQGLGGQDSAGGLGGGTSGSADQSGDWSPRPQTVSTGRPPPVPGSSSSSSSGSGLGGSLGTLTQGLGLAATAASVFGGNLSSGARQILGAVGLISQAIPFIRNLGSVFGTVSGAAQGASTATTALQTANVVNTTATAANTIATTANSTAQSTSAAGSAVGGIGSFLGPIGSIFGALFEGGGIVPAAMGGMVVPSAVRGMVLPSAAHGMMVPTYIPSAEHGMVVPHIITPSAAGGMMVPPSALTGGGQISVLHPREMVLPARLSEGVQNLIDQGSPPFAMAEAAANPTPSNINNYHETYNNNISAVDAHSLDRMIISRPKAVAKANSIARRSFDRNAS